MRMRALWPLGVCLGLGLLGGCGSVESPEVRKGRAELLAFVDGQFFQRPAIIEEVRREPDAPEDVFLTFRSYVTPEDIRAVCMGATIPMHAMAPSLDIFIGADQIGKRLGYATFDAEETAPKWRWKGR
jgi:hypothetical protein